MPLRSKKSSLSHSGSRSANEPKGDHSERSTRLPEMAMPTCRRSSRDELVGVTAVTVWPRRGQLAPQHRRWHQVEAGDAADLFCQVGATLDVEPPPARHHHRQVLAALLERESERGKRVNHLPAGVV